MALGALEVPKVTGRHETNQPTVSTEDKDGKLRLPYNRLLLGTSNRRGKPLVNRAEMDFKSYSMLGGDEGSQPSLVKYSDPSHTPASVRYSVKSESTFHTVAVWGIDFL